MLTDSVIRRQGIFITVVRSSFSISVTFLVFTLLLKYILRAQSADVREVFPHDVHDFNRNRKVVVPTIETAQDRARPPGCQVGN